MRSLVPRVLWAGLIAAVLSAGPALHAAAAPPRGARGGAQINLAGVTYRGLLNFLSQEVGKPIQYPADFPHDKKINIISGEGVTVPEDKLRAVISSALRSIHYTLLETPDFLKVVKESERKKYATGVSEEAPARAPTDEVLTQSISLKRADPTKLVKLLEALKSDVGSVVAHADTGQIVITEYAANLRDMLDIIHRVEEEWQRRTYRVRQLHYESPDTMQRILAEYVNKAGGAATKPTVVGYPSTKTLVLFGTESQVEELAALVDELDKKAPPGSAGYRVYQCKYVSAEDIAPVINQLLTGLAPAAGRTRTARGGPRTDLAVVIHENTTNSLIYRAPPSAADEIADVIARLDTKPHQILIESAFIEVTADRMEEWGFELATIDTPGDRVRGFAGTSFGLSVSTTGGKVPQPANFIAGLFKDSYGNIPVLLSLAKTDNAITVLNAPLIVTNDNQEAVVKSAENIPVDRALIGPDGTVTGVTFEAYIDAGIELKITPHVGENNHLRLEISQKVEEFQETQYSETGRPAKTTREATTTVTVPDGQTIVIAGLTRDQETVTEQKVPLLWRLWLVGNLFRKKKTVVTKKYLLVFITPHVVHTDQQAAAELEKRRNALLDAAEAAGKGRGEKVEKLLQPKK